jgi:hypothetical protein
MWTRLIWYISQTLLSGNILLTRLFADIARRGSKVASHPERGRFAGQFSNLFAHVEGSDALLLLDHCGGTIERPDTHEEMNMV